MDIATVHSSKVPIAPLRVEIGTFVLGRKQSGGEEEIVCSWPRVLVASELQEVRLEFTAITQLPAIDIARAKAWYKETLGLDPVRAGGDPFDAELFEAAPSNFGLDYDTGTAQFSIYETQYAGQNLATAMRLVTDDFDELHARLLSRGVVFEIYDIEENFHEPDGTPYFDNGALISPDGEKTAWFKDSEANIIAIGSSWG